MKRPGLVVLGGATLVLLAYLGLGAKRRATNDPEHSRVFSAFDPDAVVSIAFEKPGAAISKLERASKEDPHSYAFADEGRADPSRIGSLLSSLETASFLRQFAADTAELRGKKALTLRFSEKGGRAFVLELFAGEGPPEQLDTFCREEPGETRTCGTLTRSLAERLTHPASYYRDARVVPWPIREIAEITLVENGASTKLERNGLGFSNEKGERLERGSVEAGLRILVDARLLREQPEAPRGTRSTLRIVRKGGEAQTLSLHEGCGENKDELTLGFPFGSLYCVPKAVLRATELFHANLDRHLLPFRQDELDHVTLAGPQGRLDVIRKDADFELLGQSPRRLDRERGRAFFSYLASLEGEPVPRPETPSDAEWSFFGFAPTSDAPIEYRVSVHFTPTSVVASSEKSSLRFPRNPRLEGASEPLASLVLFGFEPHDVVSLVRSSGKRIEPLIANGEKPLSLPPATEEVVETLSHLRAETFLEKADPDENVAPLSTFSLTLRNSSAPRVLRVLERTLGGYVATLDGESHPFLLSRVVGDTLTQSLVSVPLVLEEHLADRTLLLSTPLGSLSLVPDDDGYRAEPERRLSDPDAFLDKLLELRGTPIEAPVRPNSSPLLRLRAQPKAGKPAFEFVVLERTTFRDRAAFLVTSTEVSGAVAVEARPIESLLTNL